LRSPVLPIECTRHSSPYANCGVMPGSLRAGITGRCPVRDQSPSPVPADRSPLAARFRLLESGFSTPGPGNLLQIYPMIREYHSILLESREIQKILQSSQNSRALRGHQDFRSSAGFDGPAEFLWKWLQDSGLSEILSCRPCGKRLTERELDALKCATF
jgi:hypothetical protein